MGMRTNGPGAQHSSDQTSGIVESKFGRPDEPNSLMPKAPFHQGSQKNVNQILDRQSDPTPANPKEDRKGEQGVAEVIEHVIAPAEHHFWLQYRPVVGRGADQLLRRPLRLVVGRPALGAGTQEAEERQARHGCLLRRTEHVGGALDMNQVVGLRPDLAVDAGAMSHPVAPFECPGQPRQVAEPDLNEPDTRELENLVRPRTAVGSSSEHDRVVAACGKGFRKVACGASTH